MNESFQARWDRAILLESNAQSEPARAIYRDLLEEDCDRLHVHLRLSALEQKRGRYRDARDHALAAAEIVGRRGRWGDLAAVTRRLLDFGEHGLAGSLILSAEWSDPRIVRQSAMLSQHLWLGLRVDDALRLLDAVAPHAAQNHVLSYSRALALRYLGRVREATTEFERCIALAPGYAYAHWSLAYHQPAVPEGSRRRRLERLLSATAPESAEFPYLCYALFKEIDNAGHPAEAWEYLERGARAKRAEVAFDSADEQAAFARLHDFTPSLPLRGPCGRSESAVPVFIVGMPRSGTTLLDRILGSHSRASSAGELTDFTHALATVADCVPGGYPSPLDPQSLAKVDFAVVGDEYDRRTRGLRGAAKFLIDKNPMNFANAGYICAALPQARVLCLRRSPLDVCFSNLKELFSNDAYGYSYDQDELARHYLGFDALSAHWRRSLGEQYLEISYERLVAEPLAEARRAMEFCGMGDEAPCIDIIRNAAPVATASSSQVREPIHARGVGAWRRYAGQLQPLVDAFSGSGYAGAMGRA